MKRTSDQAEGERHRRRRIERERRRGTARARGRTGTRGIQQLPLNVFNAAVEARKRSVGRSHRSVPRREKYGGDGIVWAGRSGAALASCSSWTLSLFLYVPVLPSSARLSTLVASSLLRLRVLQQLERQAATTVPGPPTCNRNRWREERGRDWNLRRRGSPGSFFPD